MKEYRLSVLINKSKELKEFITPTKVWQFWGITRQEIHNAIKRGTLVNKMYHIIKKTKKTKYFSFI